MRWLTDAPFAHRGLHDNPNGIPENSLVCFQGAIEVAGLGVDCLTNAAAELD